MFTMIMLSSNDIYCQTHCIFQFQITIVVIHCCFFSAYLWLLNGITLNVEAVTKIIYLFIFYFEKKIALRTIVITVMVTIFMSLIKMEIIYFLFSISHFPRTMRCIHIILSSNKRKWKFTLENKKIVDRFLRTAK